MDHINRPAPVAARSSPLSGVLVLELGQRVGTSLCGSLLAQLGAEVIFVERAQTSTPTETKLQHRSVMVAGKLSLAFDDRQVADRELMAKLARRADVVLLSGDMESPAPEWLPARGTNQVRCDLTAFGADGPCAGQAWSEQMVQGISGVMHATGLRDGPPVPIEFPLLEFMAGTNAASAVLAALRFQRRTGQGQDADIALYDCAFHAMSTFLPQVLTGNGATAKRVGNRHAMASPWNVYKAQDGWVIICAASDVQWQRMCEVMERPALVTHPQFARLADRVENNDGVDIAVNAWVAGMTTAQCVERLSAASVACGSITEIDGYPRERNIDYRGMKVALRDPLSGADVFLPASPLRLSRTPGVSPSAIPSIDADRSRVEDLVRHAAPAAAASRIAADTMPLSGIRVLEIGHYTTAPLAARQLANLGAEVIKIEPAGGEAVRAWPPTKNGQGIFFTYSNADKKSLMLDLRREDDVAALRRLIGSADVLIENLKPGALAKLGFGSDALAGMNPRLVYCAVSGFGHDSVYQGRPAFDTVVQAMSGMMDLIRSNGMPLKSGPSSADIMGGQLAVVAILAALAHREKTGEGQWIDLAMHDIAAWLTQTRWNARPSVAVGMLLNCVDGFVYAEAPESDRERLATAGGPDATRAQREAALTQMGVRATCVNTPVELASHPQTRARELWTEFRAGDGEVWPLLGSPLRLLLTRPQVRRPMGALDGDREALLGQVSGLTETIQ